MTTTTDRPKDRNEPPGRWRRGLGLALRDPLTHFVAGGAVLFAAYVFVSPEGDAPIADPTVIELTEHDIRQIALVWLAQGRAIPSAEQIRELANQEATQRILVREAKSLGLDQDDEVISRRLAQKMDFLLADLAALKSPSDEELRAWYADNSNRFALPPRVSFRHLYLAQDRRGVDGARGDAEKLLPVLAGIGPDDPRLAELGDQFMFRDYYGGRTPTEIAKEFGSEFATAIFTLAPGAWRGPIRSGYGWHLIWIDTLEPGHAADFATIEDAIRSTWLEERYREIRDRAYEEMLSRYTVVLPDLETIELTRDRAAASGGLPGPAVVE